MIPGVQKPHWLPPVAVNASAHRARTSSGRPSTVSIDRSRAGTAAFHRDHPTSAAAPVEPRDGCVTVRVLGDECSVEVFADDGAASLSALVYPARSGDGFALRATGGTAVVDTIELFELSP